MKPCGFGKPAISPPTLLAAAILAAVICVSPLSGEEVSGRLALGAPAATMQDGDWTVVTMAPDGSWGVASHVAVGSALAKAIWNCKVMSKDKIGCGAQSRAVRAGWIVGLRCGRTNIIEVGRLLSEAERSARNREVELKQVYAPDMPACRRVLAAGPGGAIATTTSAQREARHEALAPPASATGGRLSRRIEPASTAETYPARPVRVIILYGPAVRRTLARLAARKLGR